MCGLEADPRQMQRDDHSWVPNRDAALRAVASLWGSAMMRAAVVASVWLQHLTSSSTLS